MNSLCAVEENGAIAHLNKQGALGASSPEYVKLTWLLLCYRVHGGFDFIYVSN